MSKSLKNFITIREFLNANEKQSSEEVVPSASSSSVAPGSWSSKPAADFRLMCLLQKYHNSMYFTQERVKEASACRHLLTGCYDAYVLAAEKFFALSKEKASVHVASKKQNAESKALLVHVRNAKNHVAGALKDDFDTPTVMRLLCDLAQHTEKFCVQYATLSSAVLADSMEALTFEPVIAAIALIDSSLALFGCNIEDFNVHVVSTEGL
jgi:cysteinyl-tRNA synthetase